MLSGAPTSLALGIHTNVFTVRISAGDSLEWRSLDPGRSTPRRCGAW